MSRTRMFTLTVAVIALVIYSMQSARSEQPLQTDDWVMEIIPAQTTQKPEPAPAPPVEGEEPADAASEVVVPASEEAVPVVIDQAEYRRIYRSIPFSRAEYRVNPSYRHDATMEILTGNARHQTIIRHNYEHRPPVRRVPLPARPSRVLTPVAGWTWFPASPWWLLRGF